MIKKKYYRNYINHNNEKTRLIKSIYYTITEVILIFILIILHFKFTNKEVNIKYNNMIQINEEKNITKKNNIKEINKLKNNKQKNNNKKEINQKGIKRLQFYLQKKKAYFSISEINRYNSYIKKCQDKEFLNDTLYNKSENPKITVIMPVYNRAKHLYYSLRSIQYQKMKDIEIILINDASTDDTLEAIKKFKEEDPRIKIINNEKNRRILYSKSIGALYANGEYILELDQDDMFITDDAFNILYYEADSNNLDMIQFRDVILKKYYVDTRVTLRGMIFREQTKIIDQPEIVNNMFKKYNYLLWGLLINADIYKKTVLYLWQYIINYKIIHFEDYTVTFFFAVLSKKFKYINDFYLAHLQHEKAATFNNDFKKQYSIGVLLFYNFIFEYHIKNNPGDIITFVNLMNSYKKDMYKYQNRSTILFQYVFKKIFYYLPNDQKKLVMNVLKLKNVNIQMQKSYQYFMEDTQFNSISSFQKLINDSATNNYNQNNLYPKISVIVYFKEKKFLLNTINSIVNQNNFDNYEVILICDNNDEELSKYVNELIKNYKNIILINNEKEKGLFYSYYIGALQSKGEYILNIKSGYTLSTENFFYKLNQNINNNIDVLEFDLLINNKEKVTNISLNLYKCSHFKSKINLDFLKFNTNFKQIDQEKELIVNKLINSNIYKKIISEYKSFFINNIKYNYYDEILMFLINKKNISIKHINSTQIIEYSKIINNNYNIFQINEINKILIEDSISFINFLYKNTEDSVEGKKYALNEFYNIMNIIYNKFNEVSKEAMDLIYKFLESEYISKYEKKNLITYFNVLIDRYKYKELKEYIL